jgi:hypothetical protein
MAGARPEARAVPALDPIDWDVEAAFEPDFDFEALFAADELDIVDEVVPRARVPRSRVAFAVSVTLAALPLLFLDNFQANASTPAKVDATAPHDGLALTGPPAIPDLLPTTELPAVSTPTMAPAVVFNAAAPTTTTTAAPTTTTAAPTTTTAKPRIAALVAPTTTTTRPPAPATTSTTAAPALARASARPDPNAQSTWDQLARCESNSNWSANTGNGYYGGLQFSLATWRGLGGTGYPHQASKATQVAMGKKLYQRSGWGAWPGCQRKLAWP